MLSVRLSSPGRRISGGVYLRRPDGAQRCWCPEAPRAQLGARLAARSRERVLGGLGTAHPVA